MGTWKTRGLRGSTLEEYINYSNEKYREAGLALIQKMSTVDYIGAIQGIPVCFDAKECASTSFSLANVHEHQFTFMQEFENQGGIAFLIIFFKSLDKIIYVPLKDLKLFFDRMNSGGKKSFKFDELNEEYIIPKKGDIIVHYLESLSLYLSKDS